MAATATQLGETQVSDKPPLRDLRQEVTDNIVPMLERGVAPWQKPWEPGTGSLAMPFNPTSDRAYRGGNAIHLMAVGMARGYEDPRWMTYKQAAEKGWQVRGGEKGTQIEYWEAKPSPRRDHTSDGETASADAEEKARLVRRVYTVFNAQQIDRIPPNEPKQVTAFEAVQAGERILKNSGAQIAHDQADRAFYSRSEDSIHLPPKDAFNDAAGYYGTALHELAHWTGHPSRLNRPTLTESYQFGDTNYAREELRAELASVFLAAQRGIPHDPEQHAAYVGSWITALKRDKNEIFRAAHDASNATDFVLALERDKSIGEESLANASASSAVVLEQEAKQVRRDRERLQDAPTSEPTVRESTRYAARYEPGSSTVSVHAKQNGTEQRSTTGAPNADPMAEAKSISAKTLGDSAKTLAAQTESGAYRGPVIGITDHHVIQRQSAQTAVAHPKDLLDRQPEVGESVRINYSNSKGMVREFRERATGQSREH